LLSVLLFVMLCGVYITDRLLAEQYVKINLADPYKNFDSLPVRSFRALRLTGGNGYAIRIMQGNRHVVRIMHSRKSFFSMNHIGDTLQIGFAVANQTYQQPAQSTVGLIIMVPRLTFLRLSGTNNEIGPFRQDTLVIQQDKNTVTRLNDIELDFMQLEGSGSSHIDFLHKNSITNLAADMQNKASMNFNDISFQQFSPVLTDTAAIVLYSQSLDMFKRALGTVR